MVVVSTRARDSVLARLHARPQAWPHAARGGSAERRETSVGFASRWTPRQVVVNIVPKHRLSSTTFAAGLPRFSSSLSSCLYIDGWYVAAEVGGDRHQVNLLSGRTLRLSGRSRHHIVVISTSCSHDRGFASLQPSSDLRNPQPEGQLSGGFPRSTSDDPLRSALPAELVRPAFRSYRSL